MKIETHSCISVLLLWPTVGIWACDTGPPDTGESVLSGVGGGHFPALLGETPGALLYPWPWELQAGSQPDEGAERVRSGSWCCREPRTAPRARGTMSPIPPRQHPCDACTATDVGKRRKEQRWKGNGQRGWEGGCGEKLLRARARESERERRGWGDGVKKAGNGARRSQS